MNLRETDTSALWHPFTQMAEYADETPAPPIIVAAEGNWLIAADGRRYLDANCGYWCLALGCRPLAVERAVHAQLEKFSHSTLLGITHEPAIALAQRLVDLAGAPFGHVFFADSGSEAVEAALKMAYQFWRHRGQPERSEFLALGEAYHGDTLGAVSVGGCDVFHAAFKPLLFPVRRVPPPHCYRCPWNKHPDSCARECAQAMEQALAEHHAKLAAVLIEPFVLGPGGVIPQPEGYVERVVAAAKKVGVLTIFDEVAVGMGRLGTLFAFEQMAGDRRRETGDGRQESGVRSQKSEVGGQRSEGEAGKPGAFRDAGSRGGASCRFATHPAGVGHPAAPHPADEYVRRPSPGERGDAARPDIVCLAKGLTAGVLPMSAVLATNEVYNEFLGTHAERKTFFHGHTFTGSALGCAAALAALDEMTKPGFFEMLRCATIPAFWKMLDGLRAHPHAGNVRGRGMMAGIELCRADKSDYDYADRKGLAVVLAARERGVNLRAIGNLILAVPPLTITLDEIALLGRVLRESLDACDA